MLLTNFTEKDKYVKHDNLHDGHIFYVHMLMCSYAYLYVPNPYLPP